MARVYCGYDLNLNTRNLRFSGLPIGVFNFSVKWHHLLVFVDQLGVTTNFQDTKLYESNQLLAMPLYILQSQFLFARHMERALDALCVHGSFVPNIVRLILDTVFRGLDNGHQQFNMNINLELVIKEEVEEESIEDVSLGGYESDAEQVTRGVSKSTIEKLEQKSCSPCDGDGCCCICLEEFEGGREKVVEIPCSHLFHNKCIVEWLKRNNSCPLCRCKVEEEE
ncbi:hypothetical protein ACJRO7_014922 [Eucalyptus globulus]|uniref:RING-type domain-containing protein n=1 Tax=Eucalyptus globulus TaxID=34317 RepID=A0ABD3L2K0_EUCGL